MVETNFQSEVINNARSGASCFTNNDRVTSKSADYSKFMLHLLSHDNYNRIQTLTILLTTQNVAETQQPHMYVQTQINRYKSAIIPII